MKVPFYKYHGTGNDFIIIDERDYRFKLTKQQITLLCNRNFGIGADGLMLLQDAAGFQFRMIYYNSDGQESTMCGNGGRSMICFAKHLGLITDEASFVAVDGKHKAIITGDQGNGFVVKLKMNDVDEIASHHYYDFLDTGSPHAVFFVNEVIDTDVVAEGRKIRYSPSFSDVGTNVDFVEILPAGLKVRTYERGVENETLSCGTGVTASVLVFAMKNPRIESPCRVETKGGLLTVYFSRRHKGFSDIWLEGPALFVFKGEIEL
jgi:diaminopimelate epimerase